jgi:NAD(P)-dependent dehydrogenase (short-subunit alcohol dehydrogenase family)
MLFPSTTSRTWGASGTCVDRIVPTKRDEMSQLAGQTVVVIGGNAGMGLETARLARAEGAEVVITGRNPGLLDLDADQARDALSKGSRRPGRNSAGRCRSVGSSSRPTPIFRDPPSSQKFADPRR